MRVSGTKLSAISFYQGLGNQLYDLAGNTPSLDLRFADNKSLTDSVTGQSLVTFTRASSGTFVNSQGLIQAASTDVPRFDHNPTTRESLGLLVEEQRTNLLLRSEELGDAAWTTAAATVTSNTGVAPDGSSTADTITSSGTAVISQAVTKAASAITYTGSLFVKGTITALSFSIDDGATNNRGRVVFNLSTGATSSTSNDGTFTGTSGTITSFLNGWYRLAITTTTNSTTSVRLRTFWTGSGTSIDAWGAQLEAGAFPTSYIPTTTATVTRSADVASVSGSNFSSWFNALGGSVFCDADRSTGISSASTVFSINDGGFNNRFFNLRQDTTSVMTALSVTAGNADGSPTITLSTSSNRNRVAVAQVLNDLAIAANGSLGGVDSVVVIPVVTQANIGSVGGASYYNGTIRRLTYWPQRLPNSTLQEVTL